jgi:hypothetical protein
MKNKTSYIATSTLTLTQSGLLAELLRYQRRRVTELTQRRIHREQVPGFFGNSLTWFAAARPERHRTGARPRPTPKEIEPKSYAGIRQKQCQTLKQRRL